MICVIGFLTPLNASIKTIYYSFRIFCFSAAEHNKNHHGPRALEAADARLRSSRQYQDLLFLQLPLAWNEQTLKLPYHFPAAI